MGGEFETLVKVSIDVRAGILCPVFEFEISRLSKCNELEPDVFRRRIRNRKRYFQRILSMAN